MKTKKSSLEAFEAVAPAILLSIKGGIVTSRDLRRGGGSTAGGGGGGNCCGGGYYIPINGDGIVYATERQIDELSKLADQGLDKMSEVASIMWGITKRNADFAIQNILPLALPPLINYPPMYHQGLPPLNQQLVASN
ncbi:MAG TPA: hypothetical protein VKN36_07650 [Eudoraea sp.]|nr:hypothetical protein [Eudoraea sp.]